MSARTSTLYTKKCDLLDLRLCRNPFSGRRAPSACRVTCRARSTSRGVRAPLSSDLYDLGVDRCAPMVFGHGDAVVTIPHALLFGSILRCYLSTMLSADALTPVPSFTMSPSMMLLSTVAFLVSGLSERPESVIRTPRISLFPPKVLSAT